jgi:hypothetical protein
MLKGNLIGKIKEPGTVRKSFDVNPLATPAQAGLRPARNKEEGAYPAM